MTGDDDPDDRRPYPWADLGGSPDPAMLAHYTSLAELRDDVAALPAGDLRVLLANDAEGTVAYGRGTANEAAVVGAQPLVVGAHGRRSRSAAICPTARRSARRFASAARHRAA